METFNKRRLTRIATVFVVMICLLGTPGRQVFAAEDQGVPDVEPPVVKKVYKSYTAGMNVQKKSGKSYNLKKLLPKKIRKKYVVAQGAATDGKYVYQAFEKHNSHYCVILKYNAKTFKKVKVSKPIKIYHANDITYNPKTKKLYSINCDGKPMGITIINPKSLKVSGRKTIKVPKKLAGATKKALKKIKSFASIAYNRERNQYILRVPARYHESKKSTKKKDAFLILDENFVPMERVTLDKKLGKVPQTIECDDEHVYIPIYREKKRNEIFVYDWEGQYEYKITLKSKSEIENFIKVGKTYRATMYKAKWIKKGYNRETYSYQLSLKKDNYEWVEVPSESEEKDEAGEADTSETK